MNHSNTTDNAGPWSRGPFSGARNTSFQVTQDPATGLWHWILQSESNGPIAKAASGFKSRQALIEELRRIQARAPQSLVFDLIGNLHQGV
jgi:hypothetical protein